MFYTEEKRPSFENSSDSDIRKVVSNVVSEITKKSTNYEPERAPSFGGALQEFISHHNLSRFGLITVEIKLRDPIISLQQSRAFVFRSTLAFCERFKYDMKINGRVIK